MDSKILEEQRPPSTTSYAAGSDGRIIFHLYPETGFTGRKHIEILDTNKQPAFFVDYRSGMADMVVHNQTRNGPVIGQINLRTFKGIECSFGNGQITRISQDGIMHKRYLVSNFPSYSGSGPFYWKATSNVSHGTFAGGHLKLVDQSDHVFAVFERNSSRNKDGRLNIVQANLSEFFIREIMVSFLGILERDRRRRRSTAAAAGGGGGGA
jgi:hypothetical protein